MLTSTAPRRTIAHLSFMKHMEEVAKFILRRRLFCDMCCRSKTNPLEFLRWCYRCGNQARSQLAIDSYSLQSGILHETIQDHQTSLNDDPLRANKKTAGLARLYSACLKTMKATVTAFWMEEGYQTNANTSIYFGIIRQVLSEGSKSRRDRPWSTLAITPERQFLGDSGVSRISVNCLGWESSCAGVVQSSVAR